MLRLAFIVILIGTVIGALMPSAGSEDGARDRPEIMQVSGADSAGDGRSAETDSDAVLLKRERDGHFYADVRVNGSAVRFLVDTGATGIALSQDDAQSAGLALTPGASEVIGSGASGDVLGEFVELESVELGSTSVSDVPAVVLRDGDRSLLGQSFLSKFGSVEIRGDTMVLR